MPTTISVPPIICSVVSTSLGRATRFQGRLLSRVAVEGSYRFAVAKTGPRGESKISQGGQFFAPANLETFVGSAAVGIESGATYNVWLSIDVKGRTYACELMSGEKE